MYVSQTHLNCDKQHVDQQKINILIDKFISELKLILFVISFQLYEMTIYCHAKCRQEND